MPESSVELNGMTINLIENKTTYDGMTKNPNEMYLVEKDYDLALSLEYIYNNLTGLDEVYCDIEEGSLSNVFSKIENNDSYTPRLKITFINHYYDALYIDTVISGAQRGFANTASFSSFSLQIMRGGGSTVVFQGTRSVSNNISFVHEFGSDACDLYVGTLELFPYSPYIAKRADQKMIIELN